MEVTIEVLKKQILIQLLPNEEELSSQSFSKMGANLNFKIEANQDVNFNLIHSDHLALILLLACHPFAIGTLQIPLDVSSQFSKACKIFSRYKPQFNATNELPYVPNSNGRPGLAFSGGVDSTAALELMPQTTIPVFLDRPQLEKRSMYNKSAALATLSFLESIQIPNISLTTDVEYIRDPIGFPTDLASGIPVIALATQLNFDSIGFGTVMESAYRIGHEKSRDYSKSQHFEIWSKIFDAAGLPLFLPVAGVSEIGTFKIVRNSKFRGMAQSCIRGLWPKTCDNCWKCFRKQLIGKYFDNVSIPDDEFSVMLNSKEVLLKLNQKFIPHENVLAWTISQMDRGPMMDAFFHRLVGSTYELNHLDKYYPDTLDLLPSKYKPEVLEKLNLHLEPMAQTDQSRMLNQNFSEYITSDEYIQKITNFSKFLN